jgi:hypothetical protein
VIVKKSVSLVWANSRWIWEGNTQYVPVPTGNPELRDFAFDVHAARIEVAPQRVAHLLWLFTARAEL